MTDLFVGEVLVLFLILPVLIRPFFRRMQRLGGLALFPLLSFLLCIATISAVGLRISFLPVLALSFVVLMAGLSRLFRLFRNLPTDLYSPSLSVFYGFLLLVFALVTGVSVYTMPEAAYISRQNVRKAVTIENLPAGVDARVLTWLPPVGVQEKGVVVFEGDVSSRADGRTTLASILAESGYRVVAANFRSGTDYLSALLSFPGFRGWLATTVRFLPGVPFPASQEEIFSAQSKDLDRLVALARADGNSLPLYIVAEGSACRPAVASATSGSESVAGVVCILQKDQIAGVGAFPGGATVLSEDSGMMPANAGDTRFCVASGANLASFGMGELSGDDILAALLLGGTRDAERKNAEITARRIASWMALRSQYENK
jgi:hypothetical protein